MHPSEKFNESVFVSFKIMAIFTLNVKTVSVMSASLLIDEVPAADFWPPWPLSLNHDRFISSCISTSHGHFHFLATFIITFTFQCSSNFWLSWLLSLNHDLKLPFSIINHPYCIKKSFTIIIYNAMQWFPFCGVSYHSSQGFSLNEYISTSPSIASSSSHCPITMPIQQIQTDCSQYWFYESSILSIMCPKI